MNTLDKSVKMEATIDITVPEVLETIAKLYDFAKKKQKAVLDIVLMAYKEHRISKMKAAEILGLDYEGINKVLLERGMPTIMNLSDETERISRQNMEELSASLKGATK